MRIKTKEDRRDRIKLRIRKRVAGTPERPRLTVFRSVAHLYVQVIDDRSGHTIAAASSVEPALKATFAAKVRGNNKAGAEGGRPGDCRTAEREGHHARGVRSQRVPLSRPHQGRGRRSASGRAGVLGT